MSKTITDDMYLRKLVYSIDDQTIISDGERLGDYRMGGIYKVYYDLVTALEPYMYCYAKIPEDIIEREFSKQLIRLDEETFNKLFPDSFNSAITDLTDYLYFNNDVAVSVKDLTKNFADCYHKLKYEIKGKKDHCFKIQTAKKYVQSYKDLCAFIVSDKCVYQSELRSMDIVDSILNFGINEMDSGTKYFSFYSPYCIYSVLCTLKYAELLPTHHLHIKQRVIPEETEKQLNSRKHLFATLGMHAFSRFTLIQRKTYLVDYSRRNSFVICRDMDSVSCIEHVKPIRLLEKILSHFDNIMQEQSFLKEKNSAKLTISVFGFCAISKSNNQTKSKDDQPKSSDEIDDLLYEIFSWFEDRERYKEETLNFTLNYYRRIGNEQTNVDKCPNRVYSYFTTDSRELTCYLNIHDNKADWYSKKNIEEIVAGSTLLFFLDCPWLSSENFTLLSDGGFPAYYNWIKKISIENELENLFKKDLYSRNNVFSSLNDQFNRLAINDIAKYGKTVRVLKDYMLEWLQNIIEHSENKTAYIYSSSIRGVAMSKYARVPIIREEEYSNKRYCILRFSSRPNLMIPLEEERAAVVISLWDILKYIDISFAFMGIKEYFSSKFYLGIKLLDGYSEMDESKLKDIVCRDIISILRNIQFIINRSVSNDKKQITVEIGLSGPLMTWYNNYSCLSESHEMSDELKELNSEMIIIINYFESIIRNVIFADSKGFGDKEIRNAFSNCLYNQGYTVSDLFFHYEYKKKKKEEALSDSYEVTVKSFIDDAESIFKRLNKLLNKKRDRFDKFNDKRLYNNLFEYLDLPSVSPMEIETIIDSLSRIKKFRSEVGNSDTQNKYFCEHPRQHIKKALENIIKICSINHYEHTYLYKNCLNLYNEYTP